MVKWLSTVKGTVMLTVNKTLRGTRRLSIRNCRRNAPKWKARFAATMTERKNLDGRHASHARSTGLFLPQIFGCWEFLLAVSFLSSSFSSSCLHPSNPSHQRSTTPVAHRSAGSQKTDMSTLSATDGTPCTTEDSASEIRHVLDGSRVAWSWFCKETLVFGVTLRDRIDSSHSSQVHARGGRLFDHSASRGKVVGRRWESGPSLQATPFKWRGSHEVPQHCSRTRDRRQSTCVASVSRILKVPARNREKVPQAQYLSSALQCCLTAGLMLNWTRCVEAIWESLRQSLGQGTSASTTSSSAKSI
ncbi:hypothetical protein GE09DRAFT_251399 [Coniochaeta sp. 2T2.1]|nr:hypothetical protein GE09DRAFT_251399 [Coniochaeta sp. 2T2.1]